MCLSSVTANPQDNVPSSWCLPEHHSIKGTPDWGLSGMQRAEYVFIPHLLGTIFQGTCFKIMPMRPGEGNIVLSQMTSWKTSALISMWGNWQWVAELWDTEIYMKRLLIFCEIWLFPRAKAYTDTNACFMASVCPVVCFTLNFALWVPHAVFFQCCTALSTLVGRALQGIIITCLGEGSRGTAQGPWSTFWCLWLGCVVS